ncbi:MAG: hypothetical protein IKO35_03695 [Elusimicrobiaceae bacterium]|nr:hypothetical protein [Elusimicrobiaceae bacterium]MBR4682197.1 hypothetical protein [Elusimicrobiaceae bacterium]
MAKRAFKGSALTRTDAGRSRPVLCRTPQQGITELRIMDISRETLQKKLGIGFGDAGKLANKIEKLKYAKPQAKLEIGYLESDDITKLVLTLEFKKRNK